MQKKNKDEMKLGYVQVEKSGKKITIPQIGAEIPSMDRDQEFSIQQKMLNFLKKKESYLIPLHKEKAFINKQIRPSILKSLKEAFEHAVTIGNADTSNELAYMTIRAMNIVIKECATVLCVGSRFEKEQKEITYVDNFRIYRKVSYNALEMQEALKDSMPEIYANVKTIRNFPVVEIPKLFLTSEQEAIMNMIKQSWKTLAIAKNVTELHEIQEKIKAYQELE
jgi:hypothetical protein